MLIFSDSEVHHGTGFQRDFCGAVWRRAAGKKGALLAGRMADQRSCVVRRLGQGRAGTVGFGRFLANKAVTAAEIFAGGADKTALRAAGRRVIAIQDTTVLSFPQRRKAPNGLGPGGDGQVPGLFLHPVLAIDAADGQCLGLAAGRVWTRQPQKVCNRKRRAIEDKESYRWIEAGEAAKQALSEAAHVTLIGDRESDIYDCWARLADETFDLVTRARSDRNLADGSKLYKTVEAQPEAGRTTIQLLQRRNREARKATLALRYASVAICRPDNLQDTDLPEEIKLQIVDVREVGAGPGIEPVHWRLLTTQAVDSAADGWEIVKLYRQRWRIEEYFRILKKSGMALEDALVEGLHVLSNLVAMAAVAAVPVMQLVEGRNADADQRASQVIDERDIAFAAALCRSLEGKTERQKNPHNKGALAWLAWTVARLGSWDGYYGKPGPKTMANGWQIFQTMKTGWELTKNV